MVKPPAPLTELVPTLYMDEFCMVNKLVIVVLPLAVLDRH